jgi:hypothetical protein
MQSNMKKFKPNVNSNNNNNKAPIYINTKANKNIYENLLQTKMNNK